MERLILLLERRLDEGLLPFIQKALKTGCKED